MKNKRMTKHKRKILEELFDKKDSIKLKSLVNKMVSGLKCFDKSIYRTLARMDKHKEIRISGGFDIKKVKILKPGIDALLTYKHKNSIQQ